VSPEVEALRAELARAQRLASVGTMAAMLAHEFNNILTPIISYAELAQQNPSLVAKALDKATKGGQQARKVCKALLGLCSEADQVAAAINIQDLVAETLEVIPRELARDGIDVTVSVPEGMTIHTRAVELQQVLLNLLLNARRAVLATKRRRRTIDIFAVRGEGRCAVSVGDNGVGIAPENLDRIFEPFFSTTDASKGDGGYGLGLAICRQMIESLGGSIAVTSHLDKGAVFTLSLPTD